MFAQQASLLLWERQMLQDPEQLLDLHELVLSLLEGLARMGSAVPAAAEEGCHASYLGDPGLRKLGESPV